MQLDQISIPKRIVIGMLAVSAGPVVMATAFIDDFLISETLGVQYGGLVSGPLAEGLERVGDKIAGDEPRE